jgi:hypothetical protein
MRQRLGVSLLVLGAIIAVTQPAFTQTKPDQATINYDAEAKRLDQARKSIQPSLGATTYDFTDRMIDNVPQGENAPLNQVLRRAPSASRLGIHP